MPRRTLTALALPLVGALAFAAGGPKGAWPVYRGGPTQTGVTAATVPDKLAVLWSFKTEDALEGAVAVDGGTVFLAALDEHLYALDLASGKRRWKYKGGPFKAPPAVQGGRVYAGDLDGKLHCVDAAKGTKRWVYETGTEAELGGANFAGDTVLFASHDETLYCVGTDGKERWKFKTEGPIYGAPTVADGRTFLVGCDAAMHVLDVAKGKEERSVELGGQTGATPAVIGDRLYIGTMRNEVLAIDWKKGAVAWTFKSPRRQAFYASAAVTDAYVVIGSRDKRVYALDRKTGKEAWSFPTGDKVDASPVVAGKKVVAGSYDGKLYVLDLATGKELGQVKLDGPVAASPVVVDGRVLVGTQKGTLYCLGTKK